MKNNILKCLRKFNTLPFLFIGSGVSIRYIGLENWEGLLRKFANLTQDNEYAYEMYLQRARAQEYKEGVLPKVAELIENEFNKVWFVDTKFMLQVGCSIFPVAMTEAHRQPPSIISTYQSYDVVEQLQQRKLTDSQVETVAIAEKRYLGHFTTSCK